MKTLTLSNIKQAETLFDSAYKQLMLQRCSLKLKLCLSPECSVLPHIIQRIDELERVCQNWDLGNDFYYYTVMGQDFSKNTNFLAECRQLLDGTHSVFNLVTVSEQPTGLKDISAVHKLALSLESAIFSHQCKADERWELEFLFADIYAIIAKCQAMQRFLLANANISFQLLNGLLVDLSLCGEKFAEIKLRWYATSH